MRLANNTASAEVSTETIALPLSAIIEEGDRLFDAGQADEAISYLEVARKRFKDGNEPATEGALLRSLANFEFSLGRSREAERYLELACDRYTKAREAATAGDLYLSLGDLRAKNGESKIAREAYLQGAKLFRVVDDAAGQGHAEYKLGDLHAKTNYDMALRHYTFAGSLYDRALERLPPEEGLRLNNPHLPEGFDDCRRVEIFLMARVARREAERLRTEIGPIVEEKPAAEAPVPTVADRLRGLFVFVIVPLVFIGAMFGFTKLPNFPFTLGQTLLVPVALLAGGLSVVMARMNGVESKAVQWIGGIVVCAGVQLANVFITKDLGIQDITYDSARVGIAEKLAAAAIATDSPANIVVKRSELERVTVGARQRGDRPAEAAGLRAQAEFEHRVGAPKTVTVLYHSALEIYRELDDKPKQIEILVPLAETHRTLKQYAQAREAYNQAADLYAQQQDLINQSKILLQIGDLERNLQRPKEARAAYAKAVTLSHEKDPVAEAQSLLRLGKLDADLHATETARKAYRDALALSEQRQDTIGQADALRHLGEIEVDGGKHKEAVALYDRALTLYGEGNIKGRVRVLQLRGDLERSRKQPAAAREFYELGLAMSEEKDGGTQAAEILIALADTNAAMGERDQARDAYMRALGRHEQAKNVEGQIMTLRRLSQLVAKDNVSLAQQYAKRAATLQEESASDVN